MELFQKFLKMCHTYNSKDRDNCEGCPIGKQFQKSMAYSCSDFMYEDPDTAIFIIKKWEDV